MTSLIKATLPVRAAFRIPSRAKSRTVLDPDDAVRLRGRYDMLHLTPSGRMARLHPQEVTVHEASGIASRPRARGGAMPNAVGRMSYPRAESTAGSGAKGDRRDR